MATFLQLCQRLRLEAGMDGSGPISVVGNSNNEYARVVNWINDAYTEILLSQDSWRFMQASFSFDTAAGVGDYAEADVMNGSGLTVARYDTDTFRYYLKSAGTAAEQHIIALDYKTFRDTYRFGPSRTQQGEPKIATVAPSNGIALAAIPDGIYTVAGNFYRAPVEMTADSDVPIIPGEFHWLIMWWALANYAGFEEGSFTYRHAQNKIGQLLPKMMRQELPEISIAGTLC